jgi:neurotransmitter:Na+ symporter, NSS family
LIESKNMSRLQANLLVAGGTWLLGLGSVFSFNIWADSTVAGFTFFDFLDFLTSNVMLPLCGLLIALFVGFVMKKEFVDEEMQGLSPVFATLWRFALRFIAPAAIIAVFVMGIYDKFFS